MDTNNHARRFVLRGKVRPYVHRTYRGKWTAKAKAYHASQNKIRLQVKNQMQLRGWGMLPKGPLRVRIDMTVRRNLHRFDATNVQKAIEDACNGVVWTDDCWVDDVRTVKRLGDDDVTVLEVEALK